MRVPSLLGLAILACAGAASAQDSRPLVEPTFPPVCEVIAAPLQAGKAGPLAGGSAREEDRESARQARLIQKALHRCKPGHAVELAVGRTPAHTAFLIDPITLPVGVSLIVDGGVTVFATRNPANFQIPKAGATCGEVGQGYKVFEGCKPLIAMISESGVYGYGVLDGQGQRHLNRADTPRSGAWWDLLVVKKTCGKSDPAEAKGGCEQASPPMIYAGAGYPPSKGKPVAAKNLTLYKITIRNPPFHTVMLAGTGITAWGVKVQAPWTIPNSDGFDLRGTDILVKDVTVAIGDEDIVLTSDAAELTSRVTVEGATIYSKGGIALLGDGKGIAHMRVRDVAMTGGVTSLKKVRSSDGKETVLVNGRDPLTMKLRGSRESLTSYGQALPTATGQIQGIQLNFNLNEGAVGTVPGPVYSDIAFRSLCLQDVVWPIGIKPLVAFPPGARRDTMPTVRDIVFRDVHVLPPTAQFPAMKNGAVQPGSGVYQMELRGRPATRFFNHLTFRNVVFDDTRPGQTSLGKVEARGNVLRTVDNVYPPALNGLHGKPPPPPAKWTLSHNSYLDRTTVSDAALAIPCAASRWSFLTGELYLSRSGRRATGARTNLEAAVVPAGGSVTLNAVVQPAMSQTTWFVPDYFGADPGLLAIAAPALTEAVEFYEGGTLVGSGRLAANGTLATATLKKIALGTHTYTARYPGDANYKPFVFGSVRVTAGHWVGPAGP